jgi:fluoroacetyl-CoA thioesterase
LANYKIAQKWISVSFVLRRSFCLKRLMPIPIPHLNCFGYYFERSVKKMSSFETIVPGLTFERIVAVDENHVVTFTKTPVLSTPKMIDLMEGVCRDLVQGLLPAGYITVGYEVHVKHKAAAAIGTHVKVWCKVLEADGRKLLFEVCVSAGDMIIGEGRHRRTIIPYAE